MYLLREARLHTKPPAEERGLRSVFNSLASVKKKKLSATSTTDTVCELKITSLNAETPQSTRNFAVG